MEEAETPWSGIILTVLGLAFALFAAFSFWSDQALRRDGTRAEGTVISLVASDLTDQEAGYAPLVQWTDEQGQQRELQGSVASNPPSYAPGDVVMILYDPGNMESARIETSAPFSLGVFLFGALGLVFTLLGLSSVVPFLRNRNA